MEIVYDVRKNHANIAKHGVSFERVAECDWPRVRFEKDKRREYGEERYIATLPLEGRLHVIALTFREDRVRVISFRKANARERKKYEKGT